MRRTRMSRKYGVGEEMREEQRRRYDDDEP